VSVRTQPQDSDRPRGIRDFRNSPRRDRARKKTFASPKFQFPEGRGSVDVASSRFLTMCAIAHSSWVHVYENDKNKDLATWRLQPAVWRNWCVALVILPAHPLRLIPMVAAQCLNLRGNTNQNVTVCRRAFWAKGHCTSSVDTVDTTSPMGRMDVAAQVGLVHATVPSEYF
jgi:hypothetical protein